MKKWAIHTIFMSIILGFCQKIHTFLLPTSIGGFRGPTMPARKKAGSSLQVNQSLAEKC
jgi:hypothetical protein